MEKLRKKKHMYIISNLQMLRSLNTEFVDKMEHVEETIHIFSPIPKSQIPTLLLYWITI